MRDHTLRGSSTSAVARRWHASAQCFLVSSLRTTPEGGYTKVWKISEIDMEEGKGTWIIGKDNNYLKKEYWKA